MLVVARKEIAAPPEEVWQVVMDPDRLADWVSIHVRLGKATDRPPLEIGSRLEQTLSIRGAHFKVKWKVTQLKENELCVWEGKGPANSKALTRYALSRNGDGSTCFDYHNEFKAPMGPLGQAAGKLLVGGVSEREAKRSLDALKALIERA